VNYYTLGEEEIEITNTLIEAGHYRPAVTHACLGIEYFLKSKLITILPDSNLLENHDILGIYRELQKSIRQIKSYSKMFNSVENI
jgi:HEPN domain-containing protein